MENTVPISEYKALEAKYRNLEINYNDLYEEAFELREKLKTLNDNIAQSFAACESRDDCALDTQTTANDILNTCHIHLWTDTIHRGYERLHYNRIIHTLAIKYDVKLDTSLEVEV